MLDFFINLDKRWIFLAMFLAAGIPILLQITFPERPTSEVRDVFNAIDEMEEGSNVMLAFDYDPASAGELDPMATALVTHCCQKKHRMYFIALWPVGPRMIEDKTTRVIKAEFPEMKYGDDYVNLGYKTGGEGVIQVIASDLKKVFPVDHYGTNLDTIPLTKGLKSLKQIDFILNVSAGTPGSKEWVQYAQTPLDIPTAVGVTGVQAPLLYPYYPKQLTGILGAIKGAAEYEAALIKQYPQFDRPKFKEGIRRMAPQLMTHLLMIVLIIVGNIVFFMQRKREGQA